MTHKVHENRNNGQALVDNNIRNIAQGLHNLEASRIDKERAAATDCLLRSQEQQLAL
jgi:hypothetical protein